MWINVSSVVWMVLCLAVLLGSGVAVSAYIPVGVFLIPLILGGLNLAGSSLPVWTSLTVSALPFVLLTAVHSVLVFLFALTTLDRLVF